MKMVMMARNPALYSHRRLVEAAEERGRTLDIVNTLHCYMNITSHRPELRYKGEKLTGYDAVIPRIGASVTFYGLAVLRQFEMMGVYPLNESVAIGRSRDKLRTLQLLAREGIGLPVTGFANSAKYADDVIEIAGGAPVVIKLLEGTQGIGVVLGETHNSAKSVVEAFRGAKINILVQEFIKEAGGMDIRCLVVGGKIIAAMKRQGCSLKDEGAQRAASNRERISDGATDRSGSNATGLQRSASKSWIGWSMGARMGTRHLRVFDERS